MNPDYQIVPVKHPKLGVVGMLVRDVKPTDEILECEYYESYGAVYEIWPGSSTAIMVAGESKAKFICAKCVQGIKHHHGTEAIPEHKYQSKRLTDYNPSLTILVKEKFEVK